MGDCGRPKVLNQIFGFIFSVYVRRSGPNKAKLQATRPIQQGEKLTDLEGIVVRLQAGDEAFGNVNGYVLHIAYCVLHNILIKSSLTREMTLGPSRFGKHSHFPNAEVLSVQQIAQWNGGRVEIRVRS